MVPRNTVIRMRRGEKLLLTLNSTKHFDEKRIITRSQIQQIPLLLPFILSRPIPLYYESSKWQDDDRYDSKHNRENYAILVLCIRFEVLIRRDRRRLGRNALAEIGAI